MTAPIDNEYLPVTIDNKPITDDGSLAYLSGALHQYHDWMKRTGNFTDLCESGVTTSGRHTVADTDSTVMIASGLIADLKTHSFLDPAPSGDRRVAEYNLTAQLRTARGMATPSYAQTLNIITSSANHPHRSTYIHMYVCMVSGCAGFQQ